MKIQDPGVLARLKAMRDQVVDDCHEVNQLHIHIDPAEKTTEWDTGHSWVGFQRGNREQLTHDTYQGVGLYPGGNVREDDLRRGDISFKAKIAANLLGSSVDDILHLSESEFGDEELYTGMHHYSISLSDKKMLQTLDRAIAIIETDPLYNLNQYQCTSFAKEIVEVALGHRISAKEHIENIETKLFDIPVYGVSPRGLADELTARTLTCNVEMVECSERWYNDDDSIQAYTQEAFLQTIDPEVEKIDDMFFGYLDYADSFGLGLSILGDADSDHLYFVDKKISEGEAPELAKESLIEHMRTLNPDFVLESVDVHQLDDGEILVEAGFKYLPPSE